MVQGCSIEIMTDRSNLAVACPARTLPHIHGSAVTPRAHSITRPSAVSYVAPCFSVCQLGTSYPTKLPICTVLSSIVPNGSRHYWLVQSMATRASTPAASPPQHTNSFTVLVAILIRYCCSLGARGMPHWRRPHPSNQHKVK